LWLLEELEVPYDIVQYQRDPQTLLAPESLKKIHPLGKSPVITDNGKTFAESAAIIEYLVDTYQQGNLKPKSGTPEYALYTYWLHYAEGSLMPQLLLKLVFDRLKKSKVPFFIKPVIRKIADKVLNTFVLPNLKTHLAYVENHLKGHQWFTGGTFSAVDIQMSYVLETSLSRATTSDVHPTIAAFVEKIHTRAAYQRAQLKGGKLERL